MSLDHALHNERVCKFLDKKPDHVDWVITTAFYSSLHFATSKLFPMEIEKNGKKVKILNYESYRRINNPYNLGKHQLFEELVREKLPEIATDYKALLDLSWNARYVNYKFDREIGNNAKKRLEKIKSCCCQNVPIPEHKD